MYYHWIGVVLVLCHMCNSIVGALQYSCAIVVIILFVYCTSILLLLCGYCIIVVLHMAQHQHNTNPMIIHYSYNNNNTSIILVTILCDHMQDTPNHIDPHPNVCLPALQRARHHTRTSNDSKVGGVPRVCHHHVSLSPETLPQ